MSNLQGGLLADPYNPQRPPMQIDLNNPPCIPPQFPTPGFMVDLVPVICAAIAMNVQNKAQNSPPRMYVYNLVSANGYQNDIFAGLVMGMCDWVCLALAKREFQAPEQAAEALLDKYLEQFVAIQVLQHQELQQQTPAQLEQTVRNLANIWHNLSNEIPAFKQSNEYAAMMQGQWGRNNQGWGGNQGGWNNGGGGWNSGGNSRWGNNNSGGNWQQNRQAPRQFTGLNGGGSSGLFSSGTVSSGGSESERFNTGRFETRGMQEVAPVGGQKSAWVPPGERQQSKQAEQPAQQVETKTAEGVPEHIDSTKLVWRPSLTQPYSLAYNPRTQLMYLQKQANGTVIQLVKERTDVPMDREKHRLPTTFGAVPKHIDTAQSVASLKRISEGVKELVTPVGDGEAGQEPPKQPLVQVIEPAWILEATEGLAWLQGTLKCMAVTKDNVVPDVFRIRAQVAEPFVAATDEAGALETFREAKSYSELREMLKSVEGSLTPALYKAVNSKLTDAINRVISQQLSIPDIRIGSFVEDADDVAGVIDKFYGETFSNAFLGNQVKNIRAAFAPFVDQEDEVLFTDALLMDREYAKDKGPKLTYLISNISMTYLNINAVELELELDPADKIASMITSDQAELKELARSVFESTKDLGHVFQRHLIRTLDDHILEVTEGLIGNDAYLIRKVK